MMSILLAAVFGASVAYMFDPDRGRGRRDALAGRASTGVRRLRFSQLASRSSKSTAPTPGEPEPNGNAEPAQGKKEKRAVADSSAGSSVGESIS